MDVDDLRYELELYYIGNPPKGYEPQMDDIEEINENAQRYVEELSDEQVKEKHKNYKL